MSTRINRFLLTLVLGTSAAVVPARAAETPPTTAPATRELGVYPTRVDIPGGGVLWLDGRPATEKGAFLGISPSPVSPELREQLKLPRGVGLVVNHVEPGSPAEAAGVKRFDVIERLDDQLLIEPRQLSVLIRLRKPGDEVKLGIVRAAQPQTLTAKLVERDLPALEDVLVPATGLRTWIAPRSSAGPHEGDPFAAALEYGVATGIAWSDGELSVEVLTDKGRRRLVARNKAGEVLFDGAIDTPEQLKKLPEVVREKAMRFIHPATQPSQAQPVTAPYRNPLKPARVAPAGPPAM